MKTTIIKRNSPFRDRRWRLVPGLTKPRELGSPWALLNDKGLPFGYYKTEADAKAMQAELAELS